MFFHLNPAKLKPFQIAYKRKLTEIDSLVHSWVGNYGMSALGTVLSHMFDKTSIAEYITKPMLNDTMKDNIDTQPLTEEEIQRQTEELFLKLKIMSVNHKLSKKGSKTE